MPEDVDYQAACEHAPERVRVQYEAKAAYIDRVRQNLMQPGKTGAPADVFLCYKGGGAEQGYAQQLYYELREAGYRVFFANQTLSREAAGEEYEAVIHRAIYGAKVMLLICSDPAMLQTVWVRSEWRRFMMRIDSGADCHIIPLCYDQCDPYRLPEDFGLRGIQGLKMYGEAALTAFRTLQENLDRYVQKHRTTEDTADKRLLAIEYALSGGQWDEAAQAAEALRKDQPDCAKAYLYKLLAKMHLAEPEGLAASGTAFEDEGDWQWAMKLASPEEKAEWTALLEASLELRRQREEERRRAEEERRRAEEERRREEEERRRAEEERCQAEFAQLSDERYDKAQKLLAQGRWEDARAQYADTYDLINDYDVSDELADREWRRVTLVVLMAEYYIPGIAALARSNRPFYLDVLWRELKDRAPHEEWSDLYYYEQQARARQAHRKGLG